MGREVARAVAAADDMELVGGVDPGHAGADVGELAGLGRLGLPAGSQLSDEIAARAPDVIVDFTTPTAVFENVLTAVRARVPVVFGTTGLGPEQLEVIRQAAEEAGVGVIHAPNFAIGAVLLMRFAEVAARFFPAVEIIELHHDRKKDAPSGTALRTAELIRAAQQGAAAATTSATEVEVVAGARGGDVHGVRIHSVRLPGLVAHQEVIFGSPGQTLTIRHDSLHRESFMPGVLLAVRRVRQVRGLVVGLEHLLFEG